MGINISEYIYKMRQLCTYLTAVFNSEAWFILIYKMCNLKLN